jgi:hypothetical protein
MYSIYITSQPLESAYCIPQYSTSLLNVLHILFTPMQHVNMENLARINENSAESDE